jgi:maleylacetoacetate isomerase
MSSKPENVVLYGYFRSGSSWRVRAALNFKGIEHETKAIDLIKGVQVSSILLISSIKSQLTRLTRRIQKEAEYTAVNPQKMIPTLFIGDKKLSQSLAIIDYLEEAYPDLPSLYPKDTWARYQVRMIANMIANDIHPPQNVGILAKVAGSDMAKREEFARFVIEKGFDALEQVLKETSGRCCVGDQVSVADLCLAPMCFNAVGFFGFRSLLCCSNRLFARSTDSRSQWPSDTPPSTPSTSV